MRSFKRMLRIGKQILQTDGLCPLINMGFKFLSTEINNEIRSLWIDFYALILNKSVIHVIGDSHADVFRGSMPFQAHRLGAATAYNLIKKSNSTNSNEQLFNVIDKVRKKDIVMLCFGEIDCRIHIYYQHKKSNEKYSIGELIDRTILNYGQVMAQLKDLGVDFCVYCVSPATKVGNQYNYPFYGAPDVRSEITRTYNERLKVFCESNGYRFIDIYEKVSDKDGFMLQEYALDAIHLNKRVVSLVRAEIKRKFAASV